MAKETSPAGANGVGADGGLGTLTPEGAGAGIPGTVGGLMPNVGADGGLIAENDTGGLIAAKDGAGGVIPDEGAGGTKGVVTGTGLGGKFNLGPTSAIGCVGFLACGRTIQTVSFLGSDIGVRVGCFEIY